MVTSYGTFRNPKRERGILCRSLAYIAGYDCSGLAGREACAPIVGSLYTHKFR